MADTLHYRTSSWPVRNQRRHEATSSFNSVVLSSLAQSLERLQRFEERSAVNEGVLRSLNDKVDMMLAKMDSLGSICYNQHPKRDEEETISARVERLELAMLRMAPQAPPGLHDYAVSLFPCTKLPAHAQPDQEPSPCKVKGESHGGRIASKAEPGKCLTFDISDSPDDGSNEDGKKVDQHVMPNPITIQWQRLAGAKLASSRVLDLRGLAAAPASVRAMVSRTRGDGSSSCCSSSNDEEMLDNALGVEDRELTVGDESSDSAEDEELDDPIVENFVDALFDTFSKAPLDVASLRAATKNHLAVFVRACVERGDDRASARKAGMHILRGFVEVKKNEGKG